ncbi:MAG: hypothetical protein GXP53_04350 [Deltaproteobacteria bacterium]|nr:hypothetical protein [Deltaproteobacteria bacterium]
MADGKSLAAALALGADGIMMATRFLATKDSGVHSGIYEVLLKKTEADTALQLRTLLAGFGLQVRALKNKIMEEIKKVENDGGDLKDLIPLISGQRAKKAWADGNADDAMLTIGQSVGRINDIPTVADLVERMVSDARNALENAASAFL